MKFLENVARDLCACQRLVNFWDDDVVISRLWIPYRKTGFQEESFMKINLVANNSGTSKIHFVAVFMDMAGDLGVMVEHSNSPFVFCNPGFQWSFSLTVVYKTAVGATDFVHYARLWKKTSQCQTFILQFVRILQRSLRILQTSVRILQRSVRILLGGTLGISGWG